MQASTTLKPARAKAHKPYPGGTTNQDFTIVTVAGGEKGTGKDLARYAYYFEPLRDAPYKFHTRGGGPTDAQIIRGKLSDAVAKHGYTIVAWPKELRPT